MKISKGLLVAFLKDTTAIGHNFPEGHVLMVSKAGSQKTFLDTFAPLDEHKELTLNLATSGVDKIFRLATPVEIARYKEKNNLDVQIKKGSIFEVQQDLVLSKDVTIPAKQSIIVKKGGVNPVFSAKTGRSSYIDFTLPSKRYSDLKEHKGYLEPELADWELAKIKKNEAASQETLSFTAELLFKGKPVATIKNDGWGGPHSFYPVDSKSAPIFKQFFSDLEHCLKNKSISTTDSIYKNADTLGEAFVDYLLENEHAYNSFSDIIKEDLSFFNVSKKSGPKI